MGKLACNCISNLANRMTMRLLVVTSFVIFYFVAGHGSVVQKGDINEPVCEESIREIKSLILRMFGESRGSKIISDVETAPEKYINSEFPIVVELAVALKGDLLSQLTVQDLYREIRELREWKANAEKRIDALEAHLLSPDKYFGDNFIRDLVHFS